MEECIEVAKEVSIALRFGLDDEYSGEIVRDKIENEFNDLMGILQVLEEEGVLKLSVSGDKIKAKREKINKYLEYSKTKNTLND